MVSAPAAIAVRESEVKTVHSQGPAPQDLDQIALNIFAEIATTTSGLGKVNFHSFVPWDSLSRFQALFNRLNDLFDNPNFQKPDESSETGLQFLRYKLICRGEIKTFIARLAFVQKLMEGCQKCESSSPCLDHHHYRGINLNLSKVVSDVANFVQKNSFFKSLVETKGSTLSFNVNSVQESESVQSPKNNTEVEELADKLVEAIAGGNLGELRSLLNFKPDSPIWVDCMVRYDFFDLAVITYCSLSRLEKNHFEILNLLLKIGFDLRGRTSELEGLYCNMIYTCVCGKGNENTAIELARFLIEKGFHPNDTSPRPLSVNLIDVYGLPEEGVVKLPSSLIEFLLEQGLDMQGVVIRHEQPKLVKSLFCSRSGTDLACLYVAAGFLDHIASNEKSITKFLRDLFKSRRKLVYVYKKGCAQEIKRIVETLRLRELYLAERAQAQKAIKRGVVFENTMFLQYRTNQQITQLVWHDIKKWEANHHKQVKFSDFYAAL